MPAWDKKMTWIRNTMLGLFPNPQDMRNILDEAGVNQDNIIATDTPLNNWHNAVKQTSFQNKIDLLLHAAMERYPENPALKQLIESPQLDPLEYPNFDKRPWKADTGSQLEKIISSENNLLPIAFLMKGAVAARSVGRIKIGDGTGTGFLVADDFLVTNHHVIPTPKAAAEARLEMNYEITPYGLEGEVESFHLDTQTLTVNAGEDWALVKVKGSPTERYGSLKLCQNTVTVGDSVNIIQHASGSHKRVALQNNKVVYAGETLIQYLTDTMNGSSGSPVLNNDWEVVAVHHAGGWLPEPGDRFGKKYYRNEGINIKAIFR